MSRGKEVNNVLGQFFSAVLRVFKRFLNALAAYVGPAMTEAVMAEIAA